MQNKRIFLLGFMGAGKTTLGKRLANKSGLPFVDVDQKIEAYFQLSIQSIFEKYGEAFFRKEESKMLEKLIEEFPQAILSVGGGLPCYNNNMELMNLSGTTCYLHRPAKELFHRLKNSKENRPLLTGKSDAELLQYIRSEEHTSELQSRPQLVCRRLLEKKTRGPASLPGRPDGGETGCPPPPAMLPSQVPWAAMLGASQPRGVQGANSRCHPGGAGRWVS